MRSSGDSDPVIGVAPISLLRAASIKYLLMDKFGLLQSDFVGEAFCYSRSLS
jgi:hypothetical protein